MTKRFLIMILIITMIAGALPQESLSIHAAEKAPKISVNVTNKLDVALAVGPTDVDYSNFSEDLKEELLRQGVNGEEIFISKLDATEIGTSNNFNWWTYDHSESNVIISDATREYVEKTDESNNTGHEYYTLDRHIIVGNGGADLGFRGYGSSSYKDFMYIENNDPTKKTFNFDIEENQAYDALDGIGFLFNTEVTGSYEAKNQVMSGYLLFLQYTGSGTGQEIALYKFTNINTQSFHEGYSSLIASTPGFTKLATAPYSSSDRFRKIGIEVSPKKVKAWYKGSTKAITETLSDSDIINWTIDGKVSAEIPLEKSNAYGFGPIGSYRSHSCARLTSIDFKNLTMTTEEAKSLMEVIREPEMQSDSHKYIVNLNNTHIDDFDDKSTTSEIINRLNNDDMYYIGWGNDVNEAQTEEFIRLNNLKGDFVNVDEPQNSTYDEQIREIATTIVKRYRAEVVGETAKVLVTDNVQLTVEGADSTNTADENWPNGKWKVVHSTDGFSNVDETYKDNDKYVDDLDVTFAITGKYEIFYENSLVKTVVAHRRPIAFFTTEVVSGSAITITENVDNETENINTVSGSAITITENVDNETEIVNAVSGAAITYIDTSYDPDEVDGIDSSKTIWRYINLSEPIPTWQESSTPLQNINKDDLYLVTLIVTDKSGAVSLPFTRQISYTEDEVKMKPYADFVLSNSLLIKGYNDPNINILDKSYDLYNDELTKTFTITKNGEAYEKEIVEGFNDFSQDDVGEYKISLTVASINGTSQKVSRTLTIIKDVVPPTVVSNIENGTETGNSKVMLTFNDLGSSGFGSQKVIVTNSNETPDDNLADWSDASSSLKRFVYLKNDGLNYIHYNATDNAGNVITGYFGPITYEANNPYVTNIISPSDNSINQPVNLTVSFNTSEKVVKGDGYLTIYNKTTGKKYLDIHSSNNRVKISDAGLVTVELPKALAYGTEYYVVVGTNFVLDESGKGIASFGNTDEWSFKTTVLTENVSQDDIIITRVLASQTIDDVITTPVVNVDKINEKTFIVYVQAGTFSLLPFYSALTDNVSVTSNDSVASLSEDKLTIQGSIEDGAINPYITLHVGNNNSYRFILVQTNKEIKANIENNATSVTVSVQNSNLLNAVDLAGDIMNNDVQKINVRLLLREPQSPIEESLLRDYIASNFVSNHVALFDATLFKTVTFNSIAPTETKVKNTQEAIVINIDIPEIYQKNYEYKILRFHDDKIEELFVSIINNGTQLSFETDRFSTYAVSYTKIAEPVVPDDGYEEVKEEEKKVIVPDSVTFKAGVTNYLGIQNLPKDALLGYHISTPTIISVDKNGGIFTKKAGNGIILVSVTIKDNTTIHAVKVKVMKSSEQSSAVGFIQYYEDTISYKNINYRITKTPQNGEFGTVAVANNQVNEKLPTNVVIPMKIKIDGYSYYVTSIDESAFSNVRTIKSVSIPYTVKEISQTAFIGCNLLTSFTVSKSNNYYSSNNGMLLNKTGEKLIAYPSAKGKITIDSKITTIGAYAFSVCRGLTQVTIPSTVKIIEGCAFAHSKSLVIIKFSGDVPSIQFPSIFEGIDKNAVIDVKSKYLMNYENAFKNARQPKGIVIK